MADKLIAQQLAAYVDHVIENDLETPAERIRVLMALRDHVARLLDDQE